MSGKQVCAILERHGFAEVRRRGSHVVMQRVADDGGTTTVPVPDHKEVRFVQSSVSLVCREANLKHDISGLATSNRMKKKEQKKSKSPSPVVDPQAKKRGDWRSELLARIRAIIKEADPEAVEEVKWRKPTNPAGVPVWSHDGMICTGETYKDKVKLTFAKGASVADPARLFNASLAACTRRAIDFHEGDKINEKALKSLIRAAVALNLKRSK